MNGTAADPVADYLVRLERALRRLPSPRREQLLAEVQEHIAESRAGLHDPTGADLAALLDQIGSPEDIAAEAIETEPPRLRRRMTSRARRRLLFLLPPAVIFVVALVVLALLAATYQPLAFTGGSGGGIPGVPGPVGLRMLDGSPLRIDGTTFTGLTGEYVPPRTGSFPVVTGVVNRGPEAITIEAVKMQGPGSTVRVAGAVRYWPMGPPGTAPVPMRHPITLAPNSAIWLALPLAYHGCFSSEGLEDVGPLLVEVRYLIFTHWVSVRGQPVWVAAYSGPPGMTCLPDQRIGRG